MAEAQTQGHIHRNHDLREVDYTGDDWKSLAEDREVLGVYVHGVMNLRVR